jgi:dTDP-4-dehydrorhamnose reductase
VYGTRGENFLLRILKLALEREELKIVDDQYGAPTWSRTLARLVEHSVLRGEKDAMMRGITPTEAVQPISGIYHACSAGFTTWFGFASEFVRMAQMARPERVFARLTPIPSSAFPTAAKRPMNSRMNCEKLARTFGFDMTTWQHSMSQVMDELLAAKYI